MRITERLERESGRDFALRIIKDNIIHLKLEPGSKVSEIELASEMQLSRTPVREALIELSKVKIVEIYPQRGSTISLVDYDLVEQAQFMRETLECAVVERCCAMELGDKLSLFNENLKLQEFYLENRAPDKLWELDNEFHRMLFSAANVLQVHVLMDSMTVHFDRVRAMALLTVRDLKTVEDHNAIYRAIAARDAGLAKQVMHKHLSRYQIDRETIRAQYPQYIKA